MKSLKEELSNLQSEIMIKTAQNEQLSRDNILLSMEKEKTVSFSVTVSYKLRAYTVCLVAIP